VRLRPTAINAKPATAESPDFGAFFDREFSYVWNTLRRLGIHERDVEDISHEVFLRVYAQWAAYDPSRAARPWLFGFAYRAAADYRRLARHRVALVGDIGSLELAATETADIELILHDSTEFVHRALEQLDFDQRAVFVLHELDGCTMKAVAATLSIPVNTAYSRLRLARSRFTIVVRRMKLRERTP
jgi:RNA polymerase sigma-70 factor, ECF subfamily